MTDSELLHSLKPCSFCGSRHLPGCTYIICNNCGALGPIQTKEIGMSGPKWLKKYEGKLNVKDAKVAALLRHDKPMLIIKVLDLERAQEKLLEEKNDAGYQARKQRDAANTVEADLDAAHEQLRRMNDVCYANDDHVTRIHKLVQEAVTAEGPEQFALLGRALEKLGDYERIDRPFTWKAGEVAVNYADTDDS